VHDGRRRLHEHGQVCLLSQRSFMSLHMYVWSTLSEALLLAVFLLLFIFLGVDCLFLELGVINIILELSGQNIIIDF